MSYDDYVYAEFTDPDQLEAACDESLPLMSEEEWRALEGEVDGVYTVPVDADGVLTLPRPLLDRLGWKVGEELLWTPAPGGAFKLQKVKEGIMDEEEQYCRAVEILRQTRVKRDFLEQDDDLSESPSATYGGSAFDRAFNRNVPDNLNDKGGSRPVADVAGGDFSDEAGHCGDDYYKLPGWVEIDCLDVIEGLGLNFPLGNVIKYIWRAGRKSADPLQDLEKAADYLRREIKRLRGD